MIPLPPSDRYNIAKRRNIIVLSSEDDILIRLTRAVPNK
jgi:hypothetical protein